jgi:hypothetical protein
MIHNYWLGIMAAAFTIAMAAWLLLVFRADRHPGGTPHESMPRREVIGGEFQASEGGRQLMPRPGDPPHLDVPAQAERPAAERTAEGLTGRRTGKP